MKKFQPFAIALTVINLVMMAVILSNQSTASAETPSDVLRGRGLELVDAAGKTRVDVRIEPNGEAVFRIRDASGDIRVKIGADESGSGLLLLDETTEPGVQIISRREPSPASANTTSIKLTSGGSRRTITP